jgi:class 3 adenylate cyclase/predicted ATPase
LAGVREASVDIAAWLRGLGLQQYEPIFRDNDIDGAVLPSLRAEDLRDLGITSVGHRRRLLAAIAALNKRDKHPAITLVRNGTSEAEAERRQLTVMFCDLVGSTALSSRLDPEDLREVIGAYHRCIAEVLERFDGFIARYMGDGALIYFGYPQAREDDAERAVRAGLALVAGVSELRPHEAIKLQCRVGVATGLAVVGDLIGSGAAQEQAVIGETPNVAARLQALAEPNSVLIADSTRRQLGFLFELIDLGPQQLKGLAEPQHAWLVSGVSSIHSRFEALRSGETPFVGREDELDRLLRLWQQAKDGGGQVVLISGEPGIGKSRLAAVLRQRLQGERHNVFEYFCSPHHRETPFFPIIGQLEQGALFERDDTPIAMLDKLAALLAPVAPSDEDIGRIAELLSLPYSGRYRVPDLTAQRKKENTLDALVRYVAGFAQRRPVLMIFEDLHWTDATSREFLDLLVNRIEGLPVLLVATLRSEFQPPWTGLCRVVSVTLGRLDQSHCTAIVEQMAGPKASLSREIVAEIVERTDGVPLFLEELTKAVLENPAIGAIPATSSAVPATLHASLLARLDRLGPIAKDIAQVGSAIGRDFSYELLAATAQRTERELAQALARLVDAGLVFARGTPPQATYLFKHALVQDTAYSMLLRAARKALHARIARVLAEHFPNVAEAQPQVLAHHFTEAGLIEQAIAYWSRAGQQSAAKSAFIEAIAKLRRGLQLIDQLHDSRERKQRELELQVTLAAALMEAKGHANPEIGLVLRRARDLVLDTDSAGTILHFSVLYGLWVAQYLGGEPIAALEQAKEFLSLAQSQAQSGLLLTGHRLVGSALIPIGDFQGALSHLDRAVALYRPDEHGALAFRFGADIGITAMCVRGWALWHRGFPDQARKALDDGVQSARQSVHRHTLAYALIYAGLTAISARWRTEAARVANELVALTEEHGFALFRGYGLILQGGAMAQSGRGAPAVERIREGIAAMQATGARRTESLVLGLLAEALVATGAIAKALEMLGTALAAAEACGAHWADAELHRLRGELLQRLSFRDCDEIEGSFRTSFAVAREQGTHGFELRAAISLSRFLSKQERREEARDLLAPIYGRFTEGFETPDLKEAKALLDALDA